MKRKGSLILGSVYSNGIVSVRVHQEYLVLLRVLGKIKNEKKGFPYFAIYV